MLTYVVFSLAVGMRSSAFCSSRTAIRLFNDSIWVSSAQDGGESGIVEKSREIVAVLPQAAYI
jgi:hypothetical protein